MTHLIERFTEILKKGKYNSVTIAAYRDAIFLFYNHFRDFPQSKITDELISEYLQNLQKSKNSRYENIQGGKAILLFFEVIFSRKLNIKATGKNKEDQKIDLLSKEEVRLLFDTVSNFKHKLILMIIYGNGLKISELIKLKVNDVDLNAQSILIEGRSKVRKLRLSNIATDSLRIYIEKYQPEDILFPGSGGKGEYTARNIQMFYNKALKAANLNTELTLNTLRHSFAVHNLERGIDLKIIQEMLGHNNIQTTALYQQFAKIKIENIESPLTDLYK